MAPDYTTMTNSQLVESYNFFAEHLQRPTLKAWKGKKEEMIAKLEAIKLAAEGKQDKAAKAKAAPAETPKAIAEKPKAKQKPAKRKKSDDGRTIREASLDLLALVDYYEDKTKASNDENRVDADHKHARSVGLPYLEIIRRIKEEFDGAETSVACLRWYSVKVRDSKNHPEYSGWKLPQRRPRATPKGK